MTVILKDKKKAKRKNLWKREKKNTEYKELKTYIGNKRKKKKNTLKKR